jgi:hypothetical protein
MLVGLGINWGITIPSAAFATDAGAVCVVKIAADADILGIFANKPAAFDLTVVVPKDTDVKVPVLCETLKSLSLAIANQGTTAISFNSQVFTNQGVSLCSKGPYKVPANGTRGVTYASCVTK